MAVSGDRELRDRLRDRAVGTTIDPTTLLSADYFNLFHEVIMLLGMLPELLDELQAWRFKSYEEHFRTSALPFAGLAIEAYPHVPAEVRAEFEEIVARMRNLAEEAAMRLGAEFEAARPDAALEHAALCSAELSRLAQAGSAVVHCGTTLDQAAIDAMFAAAH